MTTPRLTPRRALLASLLLAAALPVAFSACEHADQPEVNTRDLALRDVLGLDPARHDQLDPDARQDLRERLLDASEDGWLDAWSDPHAPARHAPDLPPPFDLHPTDPLNVMRRLDAWRDERSLDPWIASVYLHSSDGAQTFACPLDPARDLDPQPAHDLPPAWDLADSKHTSPYTLRQLRSLASGLDAWRSRCLDDQDIPPDIHPRLRVVLQPNAPYLVAYWPQRYSLYIHPLLLTLWGLDEEPAPQDDLRTAARAVVYEDFDACVSGTNALCDLCTREYTAANPLDCQPNDIYPDAPLYESCDALRFSIPDGVIRYCADRFLKKPSILACFQTGASEELCGLPPAEVVIGSASTLGAYYAGFSNASTRQLCRTTLQACTLPTDGDGDGIPDDADQCDQTPTGATVSRDTFPDVNGNPTNPRYGCAADECRDAENPSCQEQKDREQKMQEVDSETTCETDCWNVTLNGSGINDCCGSVAGFDLVYYDYKRPDLRDTLCDQSQPTTCCGDAPEPEDPPVP